jgi:hypothetical protein
MRLLFNTIRSFFGRRHPHWHTGPNGRDLVWVSGPQTHVICNPRRAVISPDSKDELRIRFWTRFLLPRYRKYRAPAVATPRFIDAAALDVPGGDEICYSRSVPSDV